MVLLIMLYLYGSAQVPSCLMMKCARVNDTRLVYLSMSMKLI